MATEAEQALGDGAPEEARRQARLACLLPRAVYDVIWNRAANDYGVFLADPHTITELGFRNYRISELITVDFVHRAMQLLEREGQWLTWLDRTTKQRWALLPRWGDEQNIQNPERNTDPLPPSRVIRRCSGRTREHLARFLASVLATELASGVATVLVRTSTSNTRGQEKRPGGREEGSGEEPELANSVLDERLAEVPEKWRPALKLLYAVIGYPIDVSLDVALFERVRVVYPEVDFLRVVAAWVTRRDDEPLEPKSRPRSQLMAWVRKQAEWDAKERREADARAAETTRSGDPAQGW
jgi:hypothetical protein